MNKKKLSRRNFISKATIGITGTAISTLAGTALVASASATSMSASSYKRIIGANDRINIGFLGCGSRSRGHQAMIKTSLKDKNLGVVAVCDIWKLNREKTVASCKKLYDAKVKEFKYSEEMLKMPELDAVMIGTADFQHAKLLAEVVKAGKDCYCEKPMAQDVEEAKMARNVVLSSKQIVQMGSQWLSDPTQIKIRNIVRSGKLGKITKIEHSWNDNNHRWHDPMDQDVASIREEDTDWNRWLLGKPWCPFDPWKYFEFRIFREFSGGITSQFMSHAIGLVHFYTDTNIPDSMVADGGIFEWHDIRQNPDTFQALAKYNDAGFLYSFSSDFANQFSDYTCIRGKEGTLFAQGGEGSPRWFYIPEHQHLVAGFDFYKGLEEAIKTGKAELIVDKEEFNDKLPPVSINASGMHHLNNWIDCMRDRNAETNGNIHTGFAHSVGQIMAIKAYREDKKLYWDRLKEEIVEHN